jgi:hypothetical protein
VWPMPIVRTLASPSSRARGREYGGPFAATKDSSVVMAGTGCAPSPVIDPE